MPSFFDKVCNAAVVGIANVATANVEPRHHDEKEEFDGFYLMFIGLGAGAALLFVCTASLLYKKCSSGSQSAAGNESAVLTQNSPDLEYGPGSGLGR